MKKLSNALLIVLFTLTSCTILEFDRQKMVDDSDFAKMVGKVDSGQTWNLATSKSVTVTASGPVRVYVSDGLKSHLVAEQTVNGTHTINFDASAAARNVTVVNMLGGEVKTVPMGGSVTFSAGRTKSIYSGDDAVGVQLTDDYIPFQYSTVKADVANDAFTDVNSSAALFYSESGTFTINPVWYTNETSNTGWAPTMGIYYYDASGNRVDVPVYTNDRYSNNDEMMLISVNWGSGFNLFRDPFPIDEVSRTDFTGTCKSKGITITVPAKTAFGFYITVGTQYYGGKFYSESQYNTVSVTSDNPGPYIGEELGKYGHAALIDVSGNKYLAFDDWCELFDHSRTNAEYRHLVFSVNGDLTDKIGGDEEVEPVDPTEDASWILACEDLGSNSDFDFNDVVISVSHKADATTAEVKLLAAGGTVASTLYYGNQCLGEVHELFNVETTYMVNTFTSSEKLAPISITINVPQNFTMSATDMGGFKVVRGNATSVIAAPGQGNVPYMICIPGNWKWPKENISIVDAYPQFSAWCNDHTQNLDWYLSPAAGKTYDK